MSNGLTPTGWVSPTSDAIQTSIATDEKSLIDPALQTAPTTPLGALNTTFGGSTSALWDLASGTYAAIDPNTATGSRLDTLCAITGTVREGATSSAVVVTATGTATALKSAVLDAHGTVLVPGDVIASIAGFRQYAFTNAEPVTGPQDVWNVTVTAQCVFVAMQTGPTPCSAGTLTNISPPVTGLTSITNTLDGALGSGIETDDALRLRRVAELTPAGGATNEGIRQALLKVKGTGPGRVGVLSAVVFENDTNATDSRGLPAHSVMAVVWDGPTLYAANNDIAQTILSSKGSGITAYDGASGQAGIATYSDGRTVSIGFARASEMDIYISITVAVDSTFDSLNGAGAVAALLATYGSAIAATTPGSELIVRAFIAQATTITGVRDVTVYQWGTTPGPTGTTNISVPLLSMPVFSTSRIAVSTTPF